MAATDIKLSIVNRALSAVGEGSVTSLTPGETLPNAALEHYESIVALEIEQGEWKFGTRTSTPTLLTAEADEPLKYQWQIPSASKGIIDVLYRNVPLKGEHYDIEGNVVRCRYNTAITFQYRIRPDEEIWPERFQNIIVQRLEALFLRVLERVQDAAVRDQDTEFKTKRAKHAEARQRLNRPLADGSIVDARLGRFRRRAT